MVNDVYQLCPPLFALGVLRFDSPSSHLAEVYSRDKEFFILHKNRNLYIRNAYLGEFDLELSWKDLSDVPKLHVLVARYATGFHQVTPIYRGRSFFFGNDTTDLEIMQIVIEMQRRNGIDASDWLAFEMKRGQEHAALQASTIEAGL